MKSEIININKELKSIQDDLHTSLIEIGKLYKIDWQKVMVLKKTRDWKTLAEYYETICFPSEPDLELKKESIRQNFNNLYLLLKIQMKEEKREIDLPEAE